MVLDKWDFFKGQGSECAMQLEKYTIIVPLSGLHAQPETNHINLI